MEQEIDAELQAHLEMRIEDRIAAGMSPDAARREARLRFGNPAVVRDHIFVEDVAPMLEIFAFNVRYALRQFARNRAFTVAVMLTIALGIGLNTAMFSVIRAVLLEPLGYRAPERLVLLSNAATPIRFEEMLASAHSYDGLGAFSGGREDLALSGDGRPEVLRGSQVSGNFLDILGIRPLLGRGFLPAEDKPGAPAVAMISAELWRQRFNGTPSILGRSMTLAGTAYTIIGILPAKFQFPRARTDVWLTQPSEWSAIEPVSRRISPIMHIFGRLKPGVDIEAANTELAVIDNQYAAAHPAMVDTDKSLVRMGNRAPNHLEFLKDNLVSDVRPKLWLLFGAVGLVLLIMCANIASLLLARSKARSREFAVRAAIGAGRGRIVGQLLTESMLLSLIGGTLGVALAELAVRGVRGMTALNLPRSGEIRIDGTVLMFAIIVSLLTGLLFGLLPAVSASQPDLAGVLRGSGEGASTNGTRPALLRINPRSLLVLGQVALSTVLLIGAALLIESLALVYRVDPGFEVSNLLTMNITLPTARYGSDEKRAAFYSELLEKVEAVPGVQSAAIARTLPMTPYPAAPIQVSGRPEMKLNERPFAGIQNISPRYFQTLKIPLKRGREFTAHDDAGAVPVAIIDESMARRFWPQYPAGPNPIGDRILIGSHSQPTEIVGIVANIAQGGLTQKPQPGVYLSAAQQPLESAVLALRTEGEPLSFANAVRKQILSIDRDQPVSGVASMNEVMDASEGPLRVMMMLLGLFAGVATIIAVVGLYGVIAYSVAQRTKEIGIRRALGAQRGSILTLIVGHGFRLALGGVLLGIGGAFALSRVLHGLLFQVSTTDPTTYVGIAILFTAVALVASYLPARRAASIDPLETLRL
jgi:predicted permease